MKITENVHLIRQDFFVTPKVKRYVNIYLIMGKYCYLIDSGVSGDAIPTAHDLPIFVDYKQSLDSLDRIKKLPDVQYFCPAWDEVYDKLKLEEAIANSKKMLFKLKNAVQQVENECKLYDEQEKLLKIFEQADILQYAGNPLVIKSIDACKKYLKQIE